ncbi:MAG TPA: long-chain fatty acid--CoA ligase [Actinomycetota bacterium]|nr:long-chain fatty acid--CoA ligase [Actinomycetota bacterium]
MSERQDRSLGQLLPEAARGRGEKTVLIFGDRSISYAELDERARRAAATFDALGLRKGDRVAVMLGNVPEFIEVLHGAWRLGLVVAPLNVMLTPEEAGYVLADADARTAVVDPALLPTVLAVRDRIPGLHSVLVTGPGATAPGTRSYEEAMSAAGGHPPVEVTENDIALLQYTAGTTAAPKGAVLTHGNLLANLDQMDSVPALEQAESDVVLLVLPLFHIYALNVVLGITIRRGATAVLVERFDPVDTLDLIQRHNVTVVFGAPPMFTAWLAAAEGRDVDLSSVRIAVSGAAPLPGQILEAFRERLGVTIWEGYGLTETAPAVTTNALGEEAKADSIGLVLPGVDVRLVDEHGDDVEDGDPGEILVRGPNVFGGYWNRPEESNGSFLGEWFRTGDVAYRDEDGYLFIVDRKKDLIIVSGFNVFPKEVEDVIAQHPKVAECAVVGVPDERTGEAVKALVVLAADESATEEEIAEHCRGSLARFKCPTEVELVASLPKHVTGKVLRRALRDVDAEAEA